MGNPGLCASDAFSDWRENMPEFYHAANFFVRHPERAWAIAALFFVFFFISFFLSKVLIRWGDNIRSWILLVPAISWTVFGLLELSCKIEKANIRFDLFVTWPAILGITVICTAWWSLSLLLSLLSSLTKKRFVGSPWEPISLTLLIVLERIGNCLHTLTSTVRVSVKVWLRRDGPKNDPFFGSLYDPARCLRGSWDGIALSPHPRPLSQRERGVGSGSYTDCLRRTEAPRRWPEKRFGRPGRDDVEAAGRPGAVFVTECDTLPDSAVMPAGRSSTASVCRVSRWIACKLDRSP